MCKLSLANISHEMQKAMIKFDVHGSPLGGAARCPTGDGRMPSRCFIVSRFGHPFLGPAYLCLTCDMT
jgi:hypothetical protein